MTGVTSVTHRRRTASLALAAGLLVTALVPAWAADPQDRKREVEQRLDQAQSELNQSTRELDEATRSYTDAEAQLPAAEQALASAEQALAGAQQRLVEAPFDLPLAVLRVGRPCGSQGRQDQPGREDERGRAPAVSHASHSGHNGLLRTTRNMTVHPSHMHGEGCGV